MFSDIYAKLGNTSLMIIYASLLKKVTECLVKKIISRFID
jgi:hypothetical protein